MHILHHLPHCTLHRGLRSKASQDRDQMEEGCGSRGRFRGMNSNFFQNQKAKNTKIGPLFNLTGQARTVWTHLRDSRARYKFRGTGRRRGLGDARLRGRGLHAAPGDAEALSRREGVRRGGLWIELRGGGEARAAFPHLEEERVPHHGRRFQHVPGTLSLVAFAGFEINLNHIFEYI